MNIKPIIQKQQVLYRVNRLAKTIYAKTTSTIDKKPLTSFISLLGLMFIFILVSNFLRTPKTEKTKPIEPKQIHIFQIGSVPKMSVQAQIEKSGEIQINALTSGVISNIYITEGQTIENGAWLVSLASNYQGGNVLSLSRQLAEKQNTSVEENYPMQKDLISKQRDLANQSESNFINLRDIASKSIDDTQNLLNLNNDIINSLNDNLDNLEASPSANGSLILSTKQLKSQFESANLQLNTAIRNAQNTTNSDNPPTQLANIQKDLTLKQLDIQDKAIDLNREISKLQLQIARVNEAMMYPSAPFNGTVQRIFIKIGQYVSPGTPLVTLSSTASNVATARVFVTQDIAQKISKLEPSIFEIDGKQISIMPSFISTQTVQGTLYAVTYNLPSEVNLPDKSYVTVQIPLGYSDTSSVIPYIPIDTVYQTQDTASIFIIDGDKAKSKSIVLGNVYGGYVQVLSGLLNGDRIIIERNIIEGDAVKI